MADRKNILLRLDASVHDALARWAGDELRSTTAQIEYLLRQALAQAGRLPADVGGMPRRGRPPRTAAEPTATPEPGASAGGANGPDHTGPDHTDPAGPDHTDGPDDARPDQVAPAPQPHPQEGT